jgi:hypothetical protein
VRRRFLKKTNAKTRHRGYGALKVNIAYQGFLPESEGESDGSLVSDSVPTRVARKAHSLMKEPVTAEL